MPELPQKRGSRQIFSHPFMSLRADDMELPRGGRREFFALEFTDWANVIPLTDADELVLVRQYRHGTGAISLEIPGGIVDPGETPRQAAERELLEETGYAAREISPLGRVHSNPALQDNRTFLFLATGAHQVAAQSLDGSEDIAVELRPLSELEGLIRDGEITHSLVLCAFYFFILHRQRRE